LKSAIQQKPTFLHFVILLDFINSATWRQNSANKTTMTQQLKSIEIFYLSIFLKNFNGFELLCHCSFISTILAPGGTINKV
jgi:hypothetical protein